MKTFIFAVSIMMLSATSFAQKISDNKVPTAVLVSFKTKFPSADKATWEMENKSEYEADFTIDKKKHSAVFDKSGKWKETETEIAITALPKAVIQTIAEKFAGFKVEEAEQADTASFGIVYEVKVKKAKEKYDLMFNPSGKMLKKVVEKDGNEKD